MPDYNYVAMAATGVKSQGVLTANSEREAVSMLDSKGLMPIKLEAMQNAAKAAGGKRVSSRVLAGFFSQLADLLQSGVPLLRSLDILERQASNVGFSAVIKDIRAKVADGTGLAQAMGQHPKVLGELAISMVLAGQEGGFLEDVLRRIADFTEHQEELRSKVSGAMAYPVFLGIIGFIILNILIIFFVPQFEQIFVRLREKGQLPMITEALIGLSHGLQYYGVLLLIAAFGLWYWFKTWAATEPGRRAVDLFKISVPGMGRIFLSLSIARFARILGTLLKNGIPILQSLRIAKDSTGNKVIAEAIEKSAENIKSGDSLTTPLANSKYFPRDLVEMVSVGEESNNLEKVLLDIANGLEKRTTRELDLFVRLLEPMMLLVMAGLTLAVVAGLLLPVFKMSSAID